MRRALAARSLRPLASVFRRAAMWSMKAPVPPAQTPFMRSSGALPKYMILASSPPSSTMVSVWGMSFFTAVAAAMTSCTKGSCNRWAMPMPAEPVRAKRKREGPTTSCSAVRLVTNAVGISEKWRA